MQTEQGLEVGVLHDSQVVAELKPPAGPHFAPVPERSPRLTGRGRIEAGRTSTRRWPCRRVLHDSQVVAELKLAGLLQTHVPLVVRSPRLTGRGRIEARTRTRSTAPCSSVLHDSQVVAELKPLRIDGGSSSSWKVLHDSQVVAELKPVRRIRMELADGTFSTTHRSWPN